MALAYTYNIISHEIAYTPILVWSGTRKHEATTWLKDKLEAGESLDIYDIVRFKDGRPHSRTEINVYDFMNIDLGETL